MGERAQQFMHSNYHSSEPRLGVWGYRRQRDGAIVRGLGGLSTDRQRQPSPVHRRVRRVHRRAIVQDIDERRLHGLFTVDQLSTNLDQWRGRRQHRKCSRSRNGLLFQDADGQREQDPRDQPGQRWDFNRSRNLQPSPVRVRTVSVRSVRGVTNAVELTRAAARAGTLLVAAVLGSLGCSTGTPGTGDRDAAVDAGAPASRTADAMAPADAGAQSASDATVRPNTSTCMLAASSYDTSCSNDSDCVLAAFGNFCESTCACGNGYINAKGSAQYMAEV